MLTRIIDHLRSMDDHFQALNSQVIEGFQTTDNRFQVLEANVAQIQINVQNTPLSYAKGSAGFGALRTLFSSLSVLLAKLLCLSGYVNFVEL